MAGDYSDAHAAAAGRIALGDDLEVNRMGFGAMRLPGVGSRPPDPVAAARVLRRALERGVQLVDTADIYGPESLSERLIAEALHPYPDDLVIATKGGIVPGGVNGRPEHLRAACEASLRRLQLERIDLYQLHRPDPDVPIEESVGALSDLSGEGKIRHVGLSNVDGELLERAQAICPIASVQNRYSVAERLDEEVLDRCERDGLAFLPWHPLGEGSLESPALAELATELDATVFQVALAWLLSRSPAMLPIPGTGSVEHLEENLVAAALRLEPADVDALGAALAPGGA